jgi:hypothetical protein
MYCSNNTKIDIVTLSLLHSSGIFALGKVAPITNANVCGVAHGNVEWTDGI